MHLRLAHGCLATITDHAKRAFPEECCGLMLGLGQNVSRIVALANAAAGQPRVPAEGRMRAAAEMPAAERARRHGYLITPSDLLQGARTAKAAGLELVGVYHSHPRHLARPSARDLQYAVPSWSYLIVSCAGGATAEVRSWRLRDDGHGFVEERLSVGIEPDMAVVRGRSRR